MKVGIFSPYFSTFGGGERYIYSLASFFSRNNEVTIFSTSPLQHTKIQERFNLDLTSVKIAPYPTNILSRLFLTSGFDLFVFVSDGSIPSSLAARNMLHFQTPFTNPHQKTLLNKIKLAKFNTIICNSRFTKSFIDRTYGLNSTVLYPPVPVEKIKPAQKQNLILSVGRFFAPSHPKKQEILIDTFQKMIDSGGSDWRLVLAGGISQEHRPGLDSLKARIKNYPIEIAVDAKYQELQALYSQTKIYWHAAGYGEDLKTHPDRAEHFGITTVEAMAAGAVPIVFAGGGQKEIISDGENGFFWQIPSELLSKTDLLRKDARLWSKISSQAQIRSQDFSTQVFFDHLQKLINV